MYRNPLVLITVPTVAAAIALPLAAFGLFDFGLMVGTLVGMLDDPRLGRFFA